VDGREENNPSTQREKRDIGDRPTGVAGVTNQRSRYALNVSPADNASEMMKAIRTKVVSTESSSANIAQTPAKMRLEEPRFMGGAPGWRVLQ